MFGEWIRRAGTGICAYAQAGYLRHGFIQRSPRGTNNHRGPILLPTKPSVFPGTPQSTGYPARGVGMPAMATSTSAALDSLAGADPRTLGSDAMTARFDLGMDAEDCVCPALVAEFPSLDLRIVGLFPLGNGLVLFDVDIRGDLSNPTTTPRILDMSRKFLLEVLGASPQRLTLRMTARAGPIIESLQALGIAPILPVLVGDAHLSFTVRAPRLKIQHLYSRLKEAEVDVILANLSRNQTRTRGASSDLTPRQLELYRIARSSGYWDTPRRITLTEIAVVLGLSKSAVSEVLATIERKVMKEGLNPLGL